MPFLFAYILKLSISLAIVFAVYHLFLRRLTFYNWNRYFLLLYTFAAFLIPFIDIRALISEQSLNNSQVVRAIPTFVFLSDDPASVATSSENSLFVLMIVLLTGIAVLSLKLFFQYRSLQKIRKAAVLVHEDGLKLYHVDSNILPFSFGQAIYVNQHQHDERELREIIRHEFIHVKEKHSFDIVFGELLCILNWYNPFAWLIRKAIRQNLEFIADHALISNGLDRKQYQYLLLKVTGISQFSIATNFNFSSLKKRIAMMNKQKSAKVNLLRFLFIFPVICIALLAFRDAGIINQNKNENQNRNADTSRPRILTPPPALDLPANVRSIQIRDNQATVKLKNGDKEYYDLNDRKERNEYEEKYGDIPEPVSAPLIVDRPVPPIAPVAGMPKDYRDFLRRNDEVENVHWRSNPLRIVITLENGKKEVYNMEDEDEVKRAENKYGKLPAVPPPPPPAPLAPSSPVRVEGMMIDRPTTISVTEVPVIAGSVPNEDIIRAEVPARVNGYRRATTTRGLSRPEDLAVTEVIGLPSRGTTRSEDLAITEVNGYRTNKSRPEEIAVIGYPSRVSTTRPVDLAVTEVTGYPSRSRKTRSEDIAAIEAEVATSPVHARVVTGRGVTATAPSNAEIAADFITVQPGGFIQAEGKDLEVILKITNSTTARDLEEMRSELREKGYTLKFDETDFNDGKLTRVSATISRGDQKSSFNATDF
ncbi:MAG TPA: M56 family metallopeptidase [Flavitalea sp.]|nr:M56 family metallopeptidase [Flavitalea sp.]